MKFEAEDIYDLIRRETEKAIAAAGLVLSKKEEFAMEEGYGHAAYAYAQEDWQSEAALLEDIRQQIADWAEAKKAL